MDEKTNKIWLSDLHLFTALHYVNSVTMSDDGGTMTVIITVKDLVLHFMGRLNCNVKDLDGCITQIIIKDTGHLEDILGEVFWIIADCAQAATEHDIWEETQKNCVDWFNAGLTGTITITPTEKLTLLKQRYQKITNFINAFYSNNFDVYKKIEDEYI